MYFIVVNSKKEVLINSFDTASSINFGKHKVKKIKEYENTTTLTFSSVEKAEKFYNTEVKGSEFYYGELQTEDETYTLMLRDGYLYYVSLSDECVCFSNMVMETTIYCYPFVTDVCINFEYNQEDGKEYATVTWEEINEVGWDLLTEQKYTSYQTLKEGLSVLNQNYFAFDDETQTIKIKSYRFRGWSLTEDARAFSDYCMIITCSTDALEFVDLSK